MIVDYDGRILAQADPGPARKSSWGRSTSKPSAPSALGDRATPCFPISAPTHILRFTLNALWPIAVALDLFNLFRVLSLEPARSKRAGHSFIDYHLELFMCEGVISMQTSIMKRWAILGLLILTSIAFVGCGKKDERSIANPAVKTIPIALENSIPDDKLDEVLAAHYKGVAAMEQYDYGEAYTQFQTVHRLAPGWLPGTINLGIATLNAAGVIVEKAKAGKADAAEAGNLNQEALELFAEVLKRDPKNCYAHYCRGLILNQEGRLPETHREFVAVTEIDPNDAHAWYWRGVTVTDTDENDKPTKINIPKEQDRCFTKALELNPFLTFAAYRLAAVKGQLRQSKSQSELHALWNKINPELNAAGQGEAYDIVYGGMGRYATLIDPHSLRQPRERTKLAPPRFDPPKDIAVKFPEGTRWADRDDFKGSPTLELIGRADAASALRSRASTLTATANSTFTCPRRSSVRKD